MHKERTSSSLHYLMEIILALGVFSLCTLFCITLFVKAMQMQNTALEQEHANAIAQSQISVLKNTKNALSGTCRYDDTSKITQSGDYKAIWKLETKDTYQQGVMEVWKDTTCLTSIPFALDQKGVPL